MTDMRCILNSVTVCLCPCVEGRLEMMQLFCAAEALTKVAADFPAVTIGSYPRTEQDQMYGVKLILQSRDKDALEAASKAVQKDIKTYT